MRTISAFRAFRSRLGRLPSLLQPQLDATRKLAGVGITCDIRLAGSEMALVPRAFSAWTMRLREWRAVSAGTEVSILSGNCAALTIRKWGVPYLVLDPKTRTTGGRTLSERERSFERATKLVATEFVAVVSASFVP